ncbi:precorrin-6A synthase (deacetylating) [Halomonadaceae bacterium LMG 33818]|uniref:precorrin-6A synthase (deacetylating) n=1 Tax=Cernens ardua TaxID=3402176 RepID=UPI003EDC7EC6
MRQLKLIGIGAGDPRQLTLEAVDALKQLDVVLILEKRPETHDLSVIRQHLLTQYGKQALIRHYVQDPERASKGDYLENVKRWHRERVDRLEHALLEHLPDDGVAGLLVWGDPSLYDSALRMAHELQARNTLPLAVSVIPGVSCIQLLCARFQRPMNRLNAPVFITTGRRLRDEGFPADLNEIFVMLDGECSFGQIEEKGVWIQWGAYLGLPEEVLIEGPLTEVAPTIRQKRQALRDERGWIMDTYALQRKRS